MKEAVAFDFVKRGAAVKKRKHGAERTKGLKDLLTAWIKVDPLAAMAFLKDLGPDPARLSLSRLCIEEWLKIDHDAVLEWVAAEVRAKPDDASYYLKPILNDLGSIPTQPPLARMIAYLRQFPPTSTINAELASSVRYYIDNHPETGIATIRSVPDDFQKNQLFQYLGAKKIQSDGINNLFSDETLTKSERDSVLIGAVSAWGIFVAEGAKQWLLQQPPSPVLDSIRMQMAEKEVSSGTGQTATILAATISDPGARATATSEGLATWMRTDFEGAEQWATEHQVADATVAQAVLKLEDYLKTTDSSTFVERFNEGESNPDSRIRTRTQVTVFRQWLLRDREAALAWLEQNQSLSPQLKQRLSMQKNL